jgi:hypothetical protein
MIASIVQKNRSERVGLVPVKTLDRAQWAAQISAQTFVMPS